MADVRELLTQLALETAKATLAAIDSGNLGREQEDYTFREIVLLEGDGGKGWTGRTRQEAREVWNIHDISRIAEEVWQQFEAVWETCAQELTEQQRFTPKKDVPSIRGDLREFRLEIVRKVADSSSAGPVPDLVDRLLFEFRGGKLNWNGRLSLNGVTVSEPIEVKAGLILRPATDQDLSSEGIPTIVLQSGWDFRNPPEIPDSILEVACSAYDRPDFRREIVALSLFRVGAVEITQDDWRSDSIFPYKRGSRSGHQPTARLAEPYTLTKAEGPALAAFLEGIPDDLPIKPLGHHDRPGLVGLKNYFRALLTATDVEERLGQAVASLEASLLAGSKTEVRNRVSLRAASLLRFNGLNPTKVYTETLDAYDLRSTYAHGGEFGAKQLQQAQDLCPRIMDYARLTVVKFLQFPEKAERDEILKKLDLALLDDKECQLLEGKLKGGLWDYALPAEGQQNP
ncbi:MAG: hypothetical protein ACJ76Y_08920 [Thermoanaerobaculia bacterium]